MERLSNTLFATKPVRTKSVITAESCKFLCLISDCIALTRKYVKNSSSYGSIFPNNVTPMFYEGKGHMSSGFHEYEIVKPRTYLNGSVQSSNCQCTRNIVDIFSFLLNILFSFDAVLAARQIAN